MFALTPTLPNPPVAPTSQAVCFVLLLPVSPATSFVTSDVAFVSEASSTLWVIADLSVFGKPSNVVLYH